MELKQKILKELNSSDFPDLKLIYDDKSLDLALEILEEELKNEKKKFKDLLKIKDEDLAFESFQDDGILDYYYSLLYHLEFVTGDEKVRKITEKFRPKLEDFSHEVSYSKPYFEKILYAQKNLELDEEQKRIMYLRVKAFRDRGINLSEKKQKKLKEINKKLSKLSQKFGNNVVDDEKRFEYLITDFEVIKNLPKEVLEITKKAGEEKSNPPIPNPFPPREKGNTLSPSPSGGGIKGGGYLFDSDPTSYGAIMKYCTDRKIRKDFEKANYSFASKGKFDNRKNVLEILKLREEKAKILGYKNYAEYSLNSKMADSPKQIIEMTKDIYKKAEEKAKKEVKEMKKYFNLKELKSYDTAYYSRILREEKYEVNELELKKYFEFENVLDYLHRFIEKFYSIEIKEIKPKTYNSDVKVYEIYKGKKLISYYLIDPFFRKGKRPGAWADNIRGKTYLGEGKVPIVINVCNFQKSLKGKTSLYMHEVETIFHEFGHALHEILSESKYRELSGFGIEWDFVEFPSQFMENYVREKESLKKFAKNVETGEMIPNDLILKLENLKKFGVGRFWLQQSQFGLLDMYLHTKKVPKNLENLDKEILKIINKYSIFKRKSDYKMYCHFSHVFDGGYSAGYYSYMWAEIIEADIFAKVKELGMFSPKTGKLLLDKIIGQGVKKDAKDLFFDFMGREVDDKAFLERYGL